MRGYTLSSGLAKYVAPVVGVLALAGCGSDSPSSQLENKVVEVQASGLPVSGAVRDGRLASPESKIEQELDLRTPEGTLEAFRYAVSTKDRNTLRKIVRNPEERVIDELMSLDRVGQYLFLSKTDAKALGKVELHYLEGKKEVVDTETVELQNTEGKWLITGM